MRVELVVFLFNVVFLVFYRIWYIVMFNKYLKYKLNELMYSINRNGGKVDKLECYWF